MGGRMNMNALALTLIQTILFIAIAPLLSGIVKWIKCKLQNRRGPSIFQPYRDLRKLFHKDLIIAATASPLFRLIPYITFSIIVLACAVVPFLSINFAASSIADVIVLVGLFALSRFFITLAGMDVGTAFGGMGSSREMLIAALAEPALLLAFFAVAMIASSTNFAVIVNHLLQQHYLLLRPSLVFAAIGFALVAVAETGRIPIDNPATHLELTMIHEAMILEYSGRHLALIEWGAQIKFMLYCVLFIDLFVPWGIATHLTAASIAFSSGVLILKLLLLCTVLAIAEINLAKLRLFRAPYLLNFAFLFCLLGMLIHIMLEV
jgi:formate hydrogenlyase subunit 4